MKTKSSKSEMMATAMKLNTTSLVVIDYRITSILTVSTIIVIKD